MSPPPSERLDRFLRAPGRALWTLALPMMAGMLVHSLYAIVDMAFVGQLGPESLAAITFVGPVFFVAGALANGLGTGVTATVAQAVGQRDHPLAGRMASAGLSLGLVAALALFGLGAALGPRLLQSLGAEGATVEQGWQYLQVVFYGMPLFFVSAVLRSVLTGEGDARTPMLVIAGSTLLNLALDPLFIFTFELGVRGAALATLSAQTASLGVFSYLVLIRGRTLARIRLSDMLPQGRLVWAILAIGVPTAAGQLVMALGRGLTNRVIAHFGQLAVAGFGAGSRVDLLVALPAIGLAGACVSLVGMFAGAQRADLVRSTCLYALRLVTALALGLGLAAYASSGLLLRLFTADPQAIAVGRSYLGYMVFTYPMMGIGITSGRILQGLGRGLPSLVLTILRVLVVGVPLAYVAVYLFDAPLDAVWISFIAGGVSSLALALYWVHSFVWRRDPTRYALRARGAAVSK